MSCFAQTRIFECVSLFLPNWTVLLRLTIGGWFVKFSICVAITWFLITLVVGFSLVAGWPIFAMTWRVSHLPKLTKKEGGIKEESHERIDRPRCRCWELRESQPEPCQ